MTNSPLASSSFVGINVSAFEAITQAGLVVQIALAILIGLSVLCWAVGFLKFRQFSVLKKANKKFLARFWKATSLDGLFESLGEYRGSSMSRVFRAGFLEMRRLADTKGDEGSNKNEAGNENPVKLSGIDNLERTLRKATDIEIAAMESRLTLLATTGSTGPFIGLFGTVWGIMSSFHKIGVLGSASLAVVAPGISEALIATAVGLAAAIPAVVLYNHFVARIRREEVELNTFGSDFLNIVKRKFFKES